MATFLLEALGNNWGLPREYSGKESICQCRRCKRCRLNWPLCWEDSLKEGMATHSRILIWEIPWTQNTGMLQSMGSKRVGHKWVTEHTNTHIHAEELFSCLFQVLEDTWNSWLVTLFYFKVYHSSSLSVVWGQEVGGIWLMATCFAKIIFTFYSRSGSNVRHMKTLVKKLK